MTENFRSGRYDGFCANQKVEKRLFSGLFGLILAMFLTSQQKEFDQITHKRP